MPASTACGSSATASSACGQLEPEEHAAGRPLQRASPAGGVRARPPSRRAAPCSARGSSARGWSSKPLRITSCTTRWLKIGRVQVGRLLGLQQLRVQRRRRHHVAQAQPGRQHLRERAEVEHALGPARGQRRAAAARRTRGRRRGCPRPAAGRSRAPRRPARRGAPRCRRGRSGSGSSAAGRRSARPPAAAASASRQRAFVVAVDADELRLVRREGLQRAEVGRRLDRTRAAGVDQHLADQVQPLLRAGGDQHLVGARRACPAAAPGARRPIRAAARSLRWRRTAAPRAARRAARVAVPRASPRPGRCRPTAGRRPAR